MRRFTRRLYSQTTLLLFLCAGLLQGSVHAGPGDIYVGGDGYILQFHSDGSRSTFAELPGLQITGLACDQFGNIFAASWTDGSIHKIAPDGSQTLFASGLARRSMAMDNEGHLLAGGSGSILRFNADGSYSTVVTGFLSIPAVACDDANNIFFMATTTISYSIYKLTPDGVQSKFGGSGSPLSYLATDAFGNLFQNRSGSIHKFSPDGTESIFTSDCGNPSGSPLMPAAIC